MDGEKPERFVAGNRERAVRNVTNFDLGGPASRGKRLKTKTRVSVRDPQPTRPKAIGERDRHHIRRSQQGYVPAIDGRP